MHVFLQGVKVNQDVIIVDDEKAIDHILENLVHKGLADGGGVSKAVGHDQGLVVPSCGDKGHLPFIPFAYTDKVICTSLVEFCIDVGAAHFFKGRWDQRERETVLDHDVIQGMVINTWTESTVIFSNEEAGCSRGRRRANETIFQCFINAILHCLIFLDR
jgi:hypothetical protein